LEYEHTHNTEHYRAVRDVPVPQILDAPVESESMSVRKPFDDSFDDIDVEHPHDHEDHAEPSDKHDIELLPLPKMKAGEDTIPENNSDCVPESEVDKATTTSRKVKFEDEDHPSAESAESTWS
jgi:hypothetical protein